MSVTIPAAYPFITVNIDTSALAPIAQRSPGVIAIVGVSTLGEGDTNKPYRIDTLGQAFDLFFAADELLDLASEKLAQARTPEEATTLFAAEASIAAAVAGTDTGDAIVAVNALLAEGVADADAAVKEAKLREARDTLAQAARKRYRDNPLYSGLAIALLQDPKPSKVYGVKAAAGGHAAALASLEAADDVTFVALAAETGIPALTALKNHVENLSAQGLRRIGVGMADPTRAKSSTYAADLASAIAALKSDSSRMVIVASRGAEQDAACAAAAAIAGFAPHISMVLKRIRGVRMPLESQYSPSEIVELSEAGIIPIIDPTLIVGDSLHFAEGRCFTSDLNLAYIDIVRTLDDIEFRLKAGLIGTIGDARITRSGLTRIKVRIDGILGPLVRSAVIDAYAIEIPVLNILSTPESTWTATDEALVVDARSNRKVDVNVSVTYGPAVHRLVVTLAPKF